MVVELLVVLVALFVGSRLGSIGITSVAGVGLVVLVFGFGLKPGTPPSDVMFLIMAVVTCAGCLQAAGGIDWLTQKAEKILRRHPNRITLLAPLTTFFMTVFCGTGHIMYTIMPIICDIAIKKGIRPERPCAVASVASQAAIVSSPISAAVVAFVAISIDNGFEIGNLEVILTTMPACLVGIMFAVLYSRKRGLDLEKDPKFQKLIQDPAKYAYIYGTTVTMLDKPVPKHAKRAVVIFFTTLGLIFLISFLQIFDINLVPTYKKVKAIDHVASVTFQEEAVDTVKVKNYVIVGGDTAWLVTPHEMSEARDRGLKVQYTTDTVKVLPEDMNVPVLEDDDVSISADKLAKSGTVINGVTKTIQQPVTMGHVVQLLMLAASAVILLLCKVDPKYAIRGSIFENGMLAVVVIYGVAWLADTYFCNYEGEIQSTLGEFIIQYPWTISFVLFFFSVIVNSQGATVASVVPLAYSMGVPGWIILGVLPATYGYFFIPNYPTEVATVSLDRTGTTHIGKSILNHSFMAPGLIYVVTATLLSLGTSYLFHICFGIY